MLHPSRRRKSNRKPSARPTRRRLGLESLETRQLMAGDVAVAWNNGIVQVTGTEDSDTIVISKQGDQYVFSGSRFSLPAGNSGLPVRYGVAEFRIAGMGSRDVIYNDTDLPMIIDGGDGNDVITGGHSADKLIGGTGDDFIRGRGGNDVIRGGSGRDSLFGHLNDAYDPAVWDDVNGEGDLDNIEGSTSVDGYGYNNGVLFVSGTDEADTIVVVSNGAAMIGVRGMNRAWNRPARVEVDGRSGNDVIYNDTEVPWAVPMTAFGGIGDDTITGGHSADQLNGGDGNDFIRGRGGNDEIQGGTGNDKLYSDLDDKFTPTPSGSDSLFGGEGNDFLDHSIDVDGISWNDGVLYVQGTDRTDRNDTIIIRQNDGRLYVDGLKRSWAYPDIVEVHAGAGNDVLYNDSSIRMVAHGGDGLDNLTGGPGNDVFYSDSDELIRGRDGEDVLILQGTANSDRTVFRPLGSTAQNVQVESRGRFWNAEGIEFLRAEGGDGDDNLYNDTNLPSELNGGPGWDTLTGGGGNDVFITDSDSLVRGRGGSDTLIVLGTAGNDNIFFRRKGDDMEVESAARRWDATGIEQIEVRGEDGNDLLYNDTYITAELFGGYGNDNLVGGGAADTLHGDQGNDNLNGRGGDDLLKGGDGDDELNGGEGNDTVSYEGASQGVTVYLFDRWSNGQGRDSLLAIENIFGSEHNDWLEGDAVANFINGLSGNDVIIGHEGHDVLFGEAGNDHLVGGTGNDALFGNIGDDRLEGHVGDDHADGGSGDNSRSGGTGNLPWPVIIRHRTTGVEWSRISMVRNSPAASATPEYRAIWAGEEHYAHLGEPRDVGVVAVGDAIVPVLIPKEKSTFHFDIYEAIRFATEFQIDVIIGFASGGQLGATKAIVDFIGEELRTLTFEFINTAFDYWHATHHAVPELSQPYITPAPQTYERYFEFRMEFSPEQIFCPIPVGPPAGTTPPSEFQH